jgi:hypothetical protein
VGAILLLNVDTSCFPEAAQDVIRVVVLVFSEDYSLDKHEY